jgi:curved DNA-binding protein CbpA
MPEDPYQTLGLSNGATAKEVNRAFRKLAKQHHPDLNPGDQSAEARFKAVTAAHDYLTSQQDESAPRFGAPVDRAYAAELEQRLRDRRGTPPPGFGKKMRSMLKFFSRGG